MSEKNIYILCIETATEVLSIAIAKNGECIYSYTESERQSHAKNITLAIQKSIDATQIQFSDLSAIAINQGPGSFTGLRVASSTAKGLCFALNIPFIAIDGLKQHCIALQKNVYPDKNCFLLLDARRNNFYYSFYILENNLSLDTSFDSLEAIEKKATQIGNSILIKNTDFENSDILNAKNMCQEAFKSFLKKDFSDIRLFEPNYIINNYVKN